MATTHQVNVVSEGNPIFLGLFQILYFGQHSMFFVPLPWLVKLLLSAVTYASPDALMGNCTI